MTTSKTSLIDAYLTKKVLVRTVTHYHLGRLDAYDADYLLLAEASWVADTGRFNVALATGKLDEVERFADPVLVSRGAIVDLTAWNHALPTTSK